MWTLRAQRVSSPTGTGSPVLDKRIAWRVGVDGFDIYACPQSDVFEVVEVKVRNVSLEELRTEHELALDVLGVPTGNEGLAVSVFLVALYAGGLAGGAAGML